MLKYLSVIMFFFYNVVYTQVADTSFVNPISDSTAVSLSDSLTESDTTKPKSQSEINAIVFASSTDSLTFDVRSKRMFVYGSGELKYKQTELSSGHIAADFKTNELTAHGIIDTADTVKRSYVQTPVLTEAGEKYEGSSLKYNFKTQRGFISLAKNEEQSSRYEGEKVKKVDKNTFFIEDGIYTTCEGDPPHTFFSASKMKVIQGDKVIARWVFMYIGGVPFPIPLPFGVFPNKTGRRSGMIIPSFGTTQDRGEYFRNFGYFFAINDYLDFTLTGDYYTRGGFGTRGRLRYAKRYDFNGNIIAGYSNVINGENNDPNRTQSIDWNLSVFHHQDFTPTTKLDINLRFQTGTYLKNNTFDYDNRLKTDINSSATFSKRWEESGNSISINYQRTQNLQSGDINEVLPNVTFSKPLVYPFENKNRTGSSDKKWFEYLGYNYNGQFRNTRKKTAGQLEIRGGIQHGLNFSASPKIGHITISPRFGYKSKWYNKRLEKEVIKIPQVGSPKENGLLFAKFRDSVATNDVHELNFVRTFDFSISASTKLYGMFPVNTFGIDVIRHSLIPSVSYSISPDFSKDQWGYYDSYTLSNGDVVRYDKFSKEVFGGVTPGQSQSINFSLGNIFEMKTLKDPTDTTSEARKIQLLNLDGGIGYNFAADSLQLSDLRLSYRTQVGDFLNFAGSSNYTFYDFVEGRRVNQFLVSKGKGLFRLTNLNLSISATISGDKISGEDRTGRENETNEDYNAFNKTDFIGIYDEEPADFSIPWNVSLNYNYNISKPTPSISTISSNIGATVGINLTKNWKINMRGNYDFQTNEIIAPQITVFRDLHCWEMNFTWNPLGSLRGFRVEVRMKAPELKDIKIRKSAGGLSGF